MKKKSNQNRGATFVGLAPRYEKTKKQRLECSIKKHKNRTLES